MTDLSKLSVSELRQHIIKVRLSINNALEVFDELAERYRGLEEILTRAGYLNPRNVGTVGHIDHAATPKEVSAVRFDREKALVEAAASTIYVFDLKPEHPLSVALAAYGKEET